VSGADDGADAVADDGELRVTAELSLYPLNDAYLSAVVTFIRALERFGPEQRAGGAGEDPADRLTALRVNQMSTQLSGALPVVQRAIAAALAEVDRAGYRVALNVKLLNSELDLSAPVDLDAALDRP